VGHVLVFTRIYLQVVQLLYDLEVDPGEHENVAHHLPEVAAAMRARLSAVLRSSPEPDLASEAETVYSPEEQAQLTQRLRDLGYLD